MSHKTQITVNVPDGFAVTAAEVLAWDGKRGGARWHCHVDSISPAIEAPKIDSICMLQGQIDDVTVRLDGHDRRLDIKSDLDGQRDRAFTEALKRIDSLTNRVVNLMNANECRNSLPSERLAGAACEMKAVAPYDRAAAVNQARKSMSLASTVGGVVGTMARDGSWSDDWALNLVLVLEGLGVIGK